MGVAVIEAGEKSGSLNSAAHAVSQNKPVFAVPPCDLFDTRYKGNVRLIREGAVPLMGARDIYGEYSINPQHIIVANETTAAQLEKIRLIAEGAARAEQESDKHISEKPKKRTEAPSESEPVSENKPRQLTAEELESFSDPIQKNILIKLSEAPSSMRGDELAEALETDIDDILTALTELEILGNVQSQSGNYTLAD